MGKIFGRVLVFAEYTPYSELLWLVFLDFSESLFRSPILTYLKVM